MKEYVETIQEQYNSKVLRNPNYSMRAYARDLGLNPGTLHSILRGQRSLTMDKAIEISHYFSLSGEEHLRFVRSVAFDKISLRSILSKEIKDPEGTITLESLNEKNELNRVIEEWEFYAILNLIEINNYSMDDADIIKERLCISDEKNNDALRILLKYGYLQVDEEGILRRSQPKIKTTNDISCSSIKTSHIDALELSKKHLEDDVEEREYRVITFTSSRSRIKEAKKLIREFSVSLSDFLSDSHAKTNEDVFQLNVQFFPLSK